MPKRLRKKLAVSKALPYTFMIIIVSAVLVVAPWQHQKVLAAFPATPVQEDCNRVEGPLTDGGFWSGSPLSSESGLNASGTSCISSSSGFSSAVTAATYGPDMEAFCDAVTLETSPNETVSFYLRVSNPSNTTRTGYEIEFDTATGKPLWHSRLAANVSNAPQTYLVGGKQHVLVAAGDTLYAFSLY